MQTYKKPKEVKILGVIGDPVSHSLSPLMHNAALAHLKAPFIYKAFQISKKSLGTFVKKTQGLGIVGFNVTIPHKENILKFLDQQTPEAKRMGAVNTVYRVGPKLVGDNTDGRGYLLSLIKEAKFNPKGKNIVVLGAGGSAKAIALALAHHGIKSLTLVNRTLVRALDLKKHIQSHYKKLSIDTFSLDQIDAIQWKQTHLVINTTSVGLKSKGNISLPWKDCSKKILVSDIVYTPLTTPFLKQARKYGLKIHPGWGMLLYQGALAFERFTGRKAPISIMKRTLLDELEGN